MKLRELITEFKKHSVDGMHGQTILKIIKKNKIDNYDDLRKEFRSFSSNTIQRTLKFLEKEGCITMAGDKIYLTTEKDC